MILRRSLVSFWLTRPVTRQCRWEACSSLRLSDDKQEGCCIWKCGKILKKTVSCCDFFICVLSFCTYPHQLFRRMQLQQTWVCLFSHLTVNASKDSSTVTTDLTNTWRFYAPVNRITSTITLWACVWRETTAKQQKLRQKEHFVSSKRQNWYWKWNAHKFGNITLKSLTHIPTQQSQKGTRATSPEDVKAGVVPKGICAASVFISIVFTCLQNTTGWLWCDGIR